MADADVRIGINIISDTSGARAAQGALKEVADGAREAEGKIRDAGAGIGDAGKGIRDAGEGMKEAIGDLADPKNAEGLSWLKDALGGFTKHLDGLKDGEQRAVIAGITSALRGMGSGDITRSLGGLASALFSVTQALPLPGAGALVAASVGIVVGLYKTLRTQLRETQEEVNVFGETLDEEMERLAAWSEAELEWAGIRAGNEKLRKDFDSLKSTVENARSAIENLYSTRAAAEEAALRRKAKEAEAAGDQELAAQHAAAADLVAKKHELISANQRVLEIEQDIAAEQERQIKAAAAYEAIINHRKELAARLEALADVAEWRTGKADAFGDPAYRRKMLESDMSMMRGMEAQQAALRQGARTGVPEPDWAAQVAALEKQLVGYRKRVEDLKNFDALIEEYSNAVENASKAQAESNAEARKSAEALILANSKLKAYREELEAMERAADPEIARQAKAQAEAMAEAVNKISESAKNLSMGDAEGLAQYVESAGSSIGGITMSISEASERLAEIYERMQGFKQESDVSWLMEQAQSLYDIINAFGSAADKSAISTPDEIFSAIRENWNRVSEAIEDGAGSAGAKSAAAAESAARSIEAGGDKIATSIQKVRRASDDAAAEAIRAGTTIAKGAEDFRGNIGDAVSNFSSAAGSLRASSSAVAQVARDIAAQQRSLMAELDAVRARADAASRDAERALRQIKNRQ